MRVHTILRCLAAGGLLAIAACGNDDNGNDETPTLQVAIAGGDDQTAIVASTLAPYSALVTDPDGEPQAGVTVSWSVQTGGGSVTPTSSVTDGDGIATAVATLGTIAGAQDVRASAGGASVDFSSGGTAGPADTVRIVQGDGNRAATGSAVPLAMIVEVADQYGNHVAGQTVQWTPVAGSGTVSQPTGVTDATGRAQTQWTLGPTAGAMRLKAAVAGVDSVTFSATATGNFALAGGGNNVAERYTSDLWVADGFAYTGTWGFRNAAGNAVKIWQLDGAGVPILRDSIVTGPGGTVSDIEVSADGKWLVFTKEYAADRGIFVYELTAPGTAVFRAKNNDLDLHTGTLAEIGGKLYAFTAKDPGTPALVIYDLSGAASGTIVESSRRTIPPNYGIHDTFVRDGLAFVFAWDEGLYIFDVGKGSHGGSPGNPVQISRTDGFGGESHNGWWFWNPNGEKKYLFIGEEDAGNVGVSSSGDIHVVDVSNLALPREVAFYHLAGAGVHNFWMDEAKQILYAAYYNGGVVALDVSGTLSGNLANREIARIRPGGAGSTYVWGVMLYNNALYVSDMLSGLWQLGLP